MEKEPKNPILVVATIIFLSLFIILPPVFRKFVPKEKPVVEEKIVKKTLSCERVSVSEGRKVTSQIYFENDIALSNIMTFIVYTPTVDESNDVVGEEDISLDEVEIEDSDLVVEDLETEIEEDLIEKTIDEEIDYLKSVSGVEVNENSSQTVIKILRKNIKFNEKDEINNYLLNLSDLLEHYKLKGFTCVEKD